VAYKRGLELMEVLGHIRMMKIKGTDRNTQKNVRRRVGEEKNIMNTLKENKKEKTYWSRFSAK
jgi:hypothetical protein